jgi:general secretion pathway protein B
MSYILDALTKSDQERQRGTAPDLLTLHAPIAIERRESPHWPYVVAAALVGAVASAAWLHAGKPDGQVRPAQPIVQPQPAPLSPEPAQALAERWQSARPVVADAPAVAPLAAARQSRPAPKGDRTEREREIAARPAPADETKKSIEISRAAAVSDQVGAASPAAPHARAPAAETPAQGALGVTQLPASVQRELPKISVAGSAHSADPNERMAIINDRAMREGDEVVAGLKVEKISAEGVIFSYKGHLFRSGGF